MINGVDFLTVFVTDYPRAKKFYGEVLGLDGFDYDGAPGGEVETGSLTLQLMDAKAIGRDFTPSTHPLALHVDDFDAAKAELESRGVEFIHALDSGVCHMGFFTDPDGNTLMIHHRYKPRG